MPESNSPAWNYYNKFGGGYFYRFIRQNPEFDCAQFFEWCERRNRGDRDSGELGDIAKHEVLRLAHEYAEEQWRFPNVYGEPKE